MKLLRIHATDTINKLLISHTFTILVDTNSPDFGWEEMNSEDAKCIQKLCADVTSYYQQQITISSILIVQGQLFPWQVRTIRVLLYINNI